MRMGHSCEPIHVAAQNDLPNNRLPCSAAEHYKIVLVGMFQADVFRYEGDNARQ